MSTETSPGVSPLLAKALLQHTPGGAARRSLSSSNITTAAHSSQESKSPERPTSARALDVDPARRVGPSPVRPSRSHVFQPAPPVGGRSISKSSKAGSASVDDISLIRRRRKPPLVPGSITPRRLGSTSRLVPGRDWVPRPVPSIDDRRRSRSPPVGVGAPSPGSTTVSPTPKNFIFSFDFAADEVKGSVAGVASSPTSPSSAVRRREDGALELSPHYAYGNGVSLFRDMRTLRHCSMESAMVSALGAGTAVAQAKDMIRTVPVFNQRWHVLYFELLVCSEEAPGSVSLGFSSKPFPANSRLGYWGQELSEPLSSNLEVEPDWPLSCGFSSDGRWAITENGITTRLREPSAGAWVYSAGDVVGCGLLIDPQPQPDKSVVSGNSTHVLPFITRNGALLGCAPRWLVSANASTPQNSKPATSPTSPEDQSNRNPGRVLGLYPTLSVGVDEDSSSDDSDRGDSVDSTAPRPPRAFASKGAYFTLVTADLSGAHFRFNLQQHEQWLVRRGKECARPPTFLSAPTLDDVLVKEPSLSRMSADWVVGKMDVAVSAVDIPPAATATDDSSGWVTLQAQDAGTLKILCDQSTMTYGRRMKSESAKNTPASGSLKDYRSGTMRLAQAQQALRPIPIRLRPEQNVLSASPSSQSSSGASLPPSPSAGSNNPSSYSPVLRDHYFEVLVVSCTRKRQLSVGLSSSEVTCSAFGSVPSESLAYHADGTVSGGLHDPASYIPCSWNATIRKKSRARRFGEGDVIGCGVADVIVPGSGSTSHRVAYFTKNGTWLGVGYCAAVPPTEPVVFTPPSGSSTTSNSSRASRLVHYFDAVVGSAEAATMLRPTVCLSSPEQWVVANMARRPYMFDVTQLLNYIKSWYVLQAVVPPGVSAPRLQLASSASPHHSDHSDHGPSKATKSDSYEDLALHMPADESDTIVTVPVSATSPVKGSGSASTSPGDAFARPSVSVTAATSPHPRPRQNMSPLRTRRGLSLASARPDPLTPLRAFDRSNSDRLSGQTPMSDSLGSAGDVNSKRSRTPTAARWKGRITTAATAATRSTSSTAASSSTSASAETSTTSSIVADARKALPPSGFSFNWGSSRNLNLSSTDSGARRASLPSRDRSTRPLSATTVDSPTMAPRAHEAPHSARPPMGTATLTGSHVRQRLVSGRRRSSSSDVSPLPHLSDSASPIMAPDNVRRASANALLQQPKLGRPHSSPLTASPVGGPAVPPVGHVSITSSPGSSSRSPPSNAASPHGRQPPRAEFGQLPQASVQGSSLHGSSLQGAPRAGKSGARNARPPLFPKPPRSNSTNSLLAGTTGSHHHRVLSPARVVGGSGDMQPRPPPRASSASSGPTHAGSLSSPPRKPPPAAALSPAASSTDRSSPASLLTSSRIPDDSTTSASPVSPASVTSPTGQPAAPKLQWTRGNIIGRGAYGCVFMGMNTETAELMAAKQMKIEQNKEMHAKVEQLRREVFLMRSLSHPHIVRYLGAQVEEMKQSDEHGNEPGHYLYIFLEYVSAGSIHSLLSKLGSFAEPVLRKYTIDILKGLQYLHSKSVVHRDIKGANLLVDNSGKVKLADFGASKQVEESLKSIATAQSVQGTPFWMAPEVITKGHSSWASDIWSVGCTVVEMATAKPPFSDLHPVTAMFSIANGTAELPIPSTLSAEGQDFVRQCFNYDASKRPTAKQLLNHPWLQTQAT